MVGGVVWNILPVVPGLNLVTGSYKCCQMAVLSATLPMETPEQVAHRRKVILSLAMDAMADVSGAKSETMLEDPLGSWPESFPFSYGMDKVPEAVLIGAIEAVAYGVEKVPEAVEGVAYRIGKVAGAIEAAAKDILLASLLLPSLIKRT